MSQQSQPSAEIHSVGGFLGWIERVGNKIPDITMLFIGAFFITSALYNFYAASVVAKASLRKA